MLEDKTTETRQDMPAAAPQHTSLRARLRSRWAQFQCVRLLRRHRRFRLRRSRMDSAAKKLGASPLAARIGRQALHCARQTFRVPRCEVLEDGICIEAPVDETTLRTVTVESPLPADMAQFFR